MYRSLFCLAAAVTMAYGPQSARAQSLVAGPYTRVVDVNWTGTVTTGSDGTVQFRAPDGSSMPFAGTLPSTVYKAGDPVSISFQAIMPDQSYFNSSPFNPQLSPSGTYSIALATQGSAGCCGPIGLGTASNPTLTIGGTNIPGALPEGLKMTMVYNYNTDSYGIDPAQTFRTGPFVGNGYKFDQATGNLVACSGIACDPTFNPVDGAKTSFQVDGNADGSQMSISVPILLANGPQAGGIWGKFLAGFTGSWNLPFSGAATQVPEPGMLGLFGAGVLVLPLRRWRARKKA